MFLARQTLPLVTKCTASSSFLTCRNFAITAEEQKERVKKFEKERQEYNKNVTKLRKQYAEEYKGLKKQYDQIRAEKVKANEDAMQVIAEKCRLQKKNNRKYHYEHLCNVQIMKSIRRVNSLQNTLSRERVRQQHIQTMLVDYMPYIYNAYKPEEVEARVLKEMKEIVPFDRIFIAPPNAEVKDSDYLSFNDYEDLISISVDKSKERKYNEGLLKKWREESH